MLDPAFIEVAIEAARAAGGIVVAGMHRRSPVVVKGFRDLVTEADFKSQALIKHLLGQRFPDHGFLAEETDATGDPTAPYRWIIDPIDGTTNYSRGFPVFSVSIALVHEETPLVGVVYDPLRDHLFAAQQGAGATLNGIPIHVSETAILNSAIASLEWTRDPTLRAHMLDCLNRIAPHVQTVRSGGSAALSLCYIAAGFADIYFNLSLYAWDVAAAGLIVEAAGGRITDWEGQPWLPRDGAFLATNGLLHNTALEILRG